MQFEPMDCICFVCTSQVRISHVETYIIKAQAKELADPNFYFNFPSSSSTSLSYLCFSVSAIPGGILNQYLMRVKICSVLKVPSIVKHCATSVILL